MYSLVLMTAMTAAPDTPEFGGLFRDRMNCSGCSGAARYSCYGGCSCNGCCGGGLFGLRERVRSWWNANGCCGGSSYARAYGCCGVSYSCHGSQTFSCFGSSPPISYTPVFNGGLSCHGGPTPMAPAPVFDPFPPVPGGAVPSVPYADPIPAPPPPIDRVGVRPAAHSGPPTAMVSANGTGTRATVLVRLPADAKLYADGAALKLTGGERKFVTPELPAGMEYTYRFTAEYERNGEVVAVTRKVAVRAGETVPVEFADLSVTKPVPSDDDSPVKRNENLAAAPVSKSTSSSAPTAPVQPVASPKAPATGRAVITVKLPAGAALHIDGNRNTSIDPVRQFTSPWLPAGQEFAYLLQAEVMRNGHPEQLTQKVAFRAGEQVTVDFSGLGGGN
jgi:uncharacterized protein (TIGR03000 family)